MNRKNSSGSGVFLMEMILVVFFFMICASICILVFVRANNMSRLAKDTNQGVIMAESVAEVWKQESSDGLVKHLYAVKSDSTEAGREAMIMSWNSDWEILEQPEQAAYHIQINWTEVDGLSEAKITVIRNDDNKELFTTIVNKYHRIP